MFSTQSLAIGTRKVSGLLRRLTDVRRYANLLVVPCLLLGFGGMNVHAQTVFSFPASGAVAGAMQSATVTVTITTAGTIGTISSLTQGATGLDYALAGSGSTCVVGSYFYTVGQTCTEAVTFLPRYPGQRHGAVVLVASDGTVLGMSSLEGTATGSLSVLIPGQVTTVAGDTDWIYSGDNVAATASAIFLPMGEVTDAAGNLYIADTNNNRVRRVDAVSGTITTVAGGGTEGYTSSARSGIAAELSSPTALAIDGAGDLYIADSGNDAVLVLSTISGTLTTVAGGRAGSGGDGGQATSAGLSTVNGLALDDRHGLYIADTGNNTIRRVDLGTGVMTRFAGTGAAGYSGDGHAAIGATFNTPQGIVFGSDDSLYVADMNNNVVRKIDPGGTITTVAGGGSSGLGDGGPALQAGLTLPAAVAIDQAGNLYIADAASNRIRKVSAATGKISTLAGNGSEAFAGDGGPADQAQFYGPYSLYYDGQGNLFVGDMFHNRIRRINGSLAALKFDPIRVDRTSPPQLETLENDGNSGLNMTAPAFVNAALDPATTTCVLPSTAPVTPGAGCVLGVAFAPTILGDSVPGSLTMNSDAGNSPAMVTLVGQVLSVDPTATTLASSANPSALGTPVVFTAHVTTQGTSLTGSVEFFDGSSSLGIATLGGSNTATMIAPALTLGQHTMKAVYGGDATNAASTSAVLIQSVVQPTTVALVSSANPSLEGEPIVLTASAASSGSVPTGTMTFASDGATLGTASLNAGGVATWTVATLAIGSHALMASYAGDTLNSPSGSRIITQVVNGQASGILLTTSNATIAVGATVTFTVKVTGSGPQLPVGLVTFKDGATVLETAPLNAGGMAELATTALTPGSHTITAFYAGDAFYAGSTAPPLVETVQQLATNTVVIASANPAAAGAAVLLTAVVTPAGTTGGPVTGSVHFMSGGVALGSGTLSASGLATLSVVPLPLGTSNVTATYAGSVNYVASASAMLPLQVIQATSATMLATSESPSIAEDAVTLTATVTTNGGSATGLVSFSNGVVALGTGTLNGRGLATLVTSSLTVGQHMLTAKYAGDLSTAGGVSAGLMQTVLLHPTAVVLTSSATSLNGGQQVTLIAVVQWTGALVPSGTVIFQADGVTLGSSTMDGEGVAALTINPQPGMISVTAAYSGDATFAASTSAAVMVPPGTPPLFTVQANQTALTMQRLQHGTVDVTVASEKGFADTLLFGCAGLPVAATCTFSQDWLALAANSSATVHVVVDTGSPLTAGSVAKAETSHPLIALCGLPAGAFLCLLLWRRRRRSLRTALLLLGSMGLAGCAGITTRGTPAGTYHFQITAAAQGVGVIEAVNMTLTVTP